MARENITPNPSLKLFESYMDFSGGLNSETSNERLRNNEYVVLDNVDLSSRGSAKRRWGRTKITQISSGMGQGLFYYYRQGQSAPDIILAVNGYLYVIPNGTTIPQPVLIVDGATPSMQFQQTRMVNAVQYGTDLFIATGTKLVELTYASSAWSAKTVTPYTPSVMEAIYIGTNGLADNPDAYVQDGVSTALEVAGIKPATRTGTVNTKITMTAYANKPASITSLDYQWEYKKSSETSWTVGQAWTTGSAGKSYLFTPNTATNYDIRITARDTSTPSTTAQYLLTSYQVNQVEDKTANASRPVTGIQTCTKIQLHWDRLILSGDTSNPFQVYISDLNAPRYFPTTNTISFDTGKQEPVTAIVRYRDMLVIFTKTTIQTMTGKSPEDYQRSLIHDGIGCVADMSAAVTGNNILFLSAEGIMILKPNQFVLETLNVSRADFPIKSAITPDTNAVAMVYDSQFWICFPTQKLIYRLYYDNNMWVRDKSSKLNLGVMSHYGNSVYELSLDGVLYKQDNSVFADDGEAYDMIVEAKFLDLSAAFNYKKLKRLYVLGRHFDKDIDMFITVQADSNIVLNPDSGHATVDGTGATIWVVDSTPNMEFLTGTVVGSWILGVTPLGDVQFSVQKASIRGKCKRVKVKFRHSDNTKCEIYGFGLEYKLKKP